jgi:hypothetical protein
MKRSSWLAALVWYGTASALLSAADPASAPGAKGPPQLTLESRVLRLAVYPPDAEKGYYRGARFDWSGLVARAEYGGHFFFGEWKTPHRPENFEDAPGTAEEFGTLRPLGYTEAKPGETFIKIGVGELEKPAEPAYRFHYNYKIVRPAMWDVTSGRDWVEFRQELKADSGYGYHYVKRITLDEKEPAFMVSHSLKNTGDKAIETDHYCHNFIRIDDDPVGTHYRIGFSFPAKPKAKPAPHGPVELRGRELVFREDMVKGDFYLELEGLTGRASDNEVIVENTAKGAGVRVRGDHVLSDFHVWGVKTALCPEPFIELKLAPGAAAKWSNRYTFFAAKEGGDKADR